MSASTIPLAAPWASLPREPGRPRALVAIAFLVALGILMIGSLVATADEWSLARARHQAPPVSLDPADPNC